MSDKPDETKQQSPLILVDGSSYLYRAFHALPPLATSAGLPTGAVKGVINMIQKLVAQYSADEVGVVFDAKGKTFRDDLYSDYKANRPSMPDDLRQQIEPLYELVKALGYPMLIVPGVEADDVIGTLSVAASQQQRHCVISTGDKDMAQLVDPYTTLINTMNNKAMDIAGVEEKFGVRPEQIIDYLALVGDTADNIPGVAGCGPKTAVKWLAQYQTLQGVIDNAGDIKGKIGEKLRASIETLPMSYELATIKTDVELELGFDQLQLLEPDEEKLLELYELLEFKTVLKGLKSGAGSSSPSSPFASAVSAAVTDPNAPVAPVVESKSYETVLDKARFEEWLAKLQDAELIAFDTETTSLDYMLAEVVGVSFSIEAGVAAYIPVAHDYEGAPEQLPRDYVLQALKPLLESKSVKLLGQNLKYDANVLVKYGIFLDGVEHDTMLQSYIFNSTATAHNMDKLAEKYLGETTVHFEEIAGKGKKQLTFNQIELEKAGHYAAEDADITLRLHQALWPSIEKTETLKNLYQKTEIALIPVLSRIECNGVRIDVDMMEKQSAEFVIKLAELEAEAYEDAGREFNLGSPKQIQEIFFEEKNFPIIAKTPKGQPSTAENVMVQLAQTYKLPDIILKHRSLSKLKSTYLDKLPLQVNPSSGRIHTSYHQAVASTGRLSSADPNLQNIPIRTEEGRRIREAFVPENGYRLVAADYSQIELRIMAHLSADAGLLKAFAEGQDIHKSTAAEVFAVDLENVEVEQRRAAKAINFGLIYGMSAFGLAKQLDVQRREAQEYIDLYFARYPGVKTYMESTKELARQQEYVETVFGRRLYLPDINARNGQLRQYAERTAINAPMQGTAADIIKRAMISVDHWLSESGVDARIIMQVHDELVLEVQAGKAEEIGQKVSDLMVAAATLSVPLEVDVGIGNSWEEAH